MSVFDVKLRSTCDKVIMSGDIMSLIEQYRESGELPDDPAILMQLHAEMVANEALDKQVESSVETTDELR